MISIAPSQILEFTVLTDKAGKKTKIILNIDLISSSKKKFKFLNEFMFLKLWGKNNQFAIL